MDTLLQNNEPRLLHQSLRKPKVLLASTVHWVCTARLAMALVAAGCAVEAVCPSKHPITKTRAVSKGYPYRAFSAVQSIATAIMEGQPEFVIPCDDLATVYLHRLYDQLFEWGERGETMRALIKRSLGDPAHFPTTTSRSGLMHLAKWNGVRVPTTAPVRDTAELTEWLHCHGFPAVLKADGTYGGEGVRIVNTEAEAVQSFNELTSPPSLARAIKRALVNRNLSCALHCARRVRSIVSVQRLICGRDMNATVACLEGQVLASITASVLHKFAITSPATVLEFVDNREIATAVEQIVGELRLSGVVGFDFILEEKTGDAYLIELNPRATQLAHINLGADRNIPGSLVTALSGQLPQNDQAVVTSSTITVFPQEWLRDPASPFLKTGYHDVPWEEPGLIRACLQEDSRYKIWAMVSSIAWFVHSALYKLTDSSRAKSVNLSH